MKNPYTQTIPAGENASYTFNISLQDEMAFCFTYLTESDFNNETRMAELKSFLLEAQVPVCTTFLFLPLNIFIIFDFLFFFLRSSFPLPSSFLSLSLYLSLFHSRLFQIFQIPKIAHMRIAVQPHHSTYCQMGTSSVNSLSLFDTL